MTALIVLSKAVAVAALLVLGGCASKTPPEAARVHGIATTDAPAIDACWRKALASPQHQALRERMGDHADSPTAAMKSNPAKATPQEAALLRSLQQDYLAPCRTMALASAAKVHPAIVAILTDSYGRADANTARLVGREISWGEYVSENQAIVTHRRAELLAAGEAMQREQQRQPPSPLTHGLPARARPRALMRALARGFDEALRPAGLTSGQFSLLMSLNQPRPPSIGAVAGLLAMVGTTLTANLKPLERAALGAPNLAAHAQGDRPASLTGGWQG